MKMLSTTNTNSKSSLEKEIHKISSEVQLKRYGLFLEKHESSMGDILSSMRYGVAPYSEVTRNIIKIDLSLKETVSLSKLINVEHSFTNKVIESFTTLCAEVKFLKNEATYKYYNLIMLYGEDTEEKIQEYVGFSKLDNMLNMLNELNSFIKRCQLVTTEIIVQLNSLSKSDKLTQFSFIGAIDTDVFCYVGDMLLVLITIEEILQNSIILEHWRMYRRTVKSVHRSYSSFNLDLDTLENLDEVLNSIENDLLSDHIFQNTLEKCCGCLHPKADMNKPLEKRFYAYLKSLASDLEKSELDLIDNVKSMQWVKLNALYIFYVKVFGASDKRFLKNLKDINKKVPCITLVGNVVWCAEKFLSQYSSILKGFDSKTVQEMQRVRQTYLQNKTQSLLRDTHSFALQVASWILEITNILQEGTNNLKLEHLTFRTNLLLQGITYAGQLNLVIKSLTNLHVSQNKPMTKSCLLAVCKLIELLKAVYQVFINNSSKIVNFAHNIMQYLIFQSLTIISLTKKSLLSDKSYNKKHPEAMVALMLFERALHGPGTDNRLMVAHFALSNLNASQVFQEDNLNKLLKLLKTMERVQNLQESLENITDCSFLFWHQSILPSYFANVYESKMDIAKITYMYQALNDFQESEKNQGIYTKAIESSLKEKVLEPLCSQIETDLRLQIHSHLQPGLVNPFDDGTPDVSSNLLELNPILYGQKFIDIKGYVENYLDCMFYNLTTVVLFDWKTYGEMRRLAYEKFSLQTVEDHLPTQTLEQGLDVLEIMRNIHIFVSKYLYNLNNQIFIEKWSNNKHLNTINIQHVANSIRTHGTGIMNTTVNLTYQFLKKKFFVFSQFLYDEHIKSRLLKDLRYFREHRSESNPMYSYDRAYNFNKAIRKLGVSPTGQSFLDHFRLLITHLGNAMGYVRMIRSGGLHSCSNASVFLPMLDENDTFEDLCQKNNLSSTVCEAAHVLEQDIRNLASNFAEGSEYFKLLVDVFAPEFRNPRNIHLRNFYIIVPPLTINFVEHLITAKDKLTKKDKSGAAFTDDGFAMGLAYILKLLDQNGEMDSLHWFQAVSEKCSLEKRALSEQKQNMCKDDQKLQNTLSLTARRLDMLEQEFKLLYYSFSSARIFFQ